MVRIWSRNCDLWLSIPQLVFVLSSTGTSLIHPPAASPPHTHTPLLLLQPLPSCPVGRDDALAARRLFSEVLVFRWHRGGGWSRNSAGVVVFSVGVGDLGRAGLVGDQWASKPLCRQKETREDCVSQLSACRFSLGLLTHKFDEQRCLSRQSWDI